MSNLSNEKLKMLAAESGIFLALILGVIKAITAFYTGSLSIFSSMIDSLADAFSSLISLIAVRFSALPLSDRHRYGYGKAESLSAFLQAAFIIGSGFFVLYDGIRRFIKPENVTETTLGLVVMIFSIFATFAVILFQKYAARKTKSLALEAESQHYVVDILTNSAIILALFGLKYFGWQWIDILTALGISGYLIFNAVILAIKALDDITDREADDETKRIILDIVAQTKGVLGCHDLRSRVSGARVFVELHLELNGEQRLFEAHKISDEVEDKIKERLPYVQVIIHQDPFGLKENRLDDELKGHCDL
ncbi:MAG: cation diffusion facilitator family transporter [Alphaproteobacteria bacterium]|nr:cation diffusion facilitator family transporter [Alphaproteobacteria bacterium]